METYPLVSCIMVTTAGRREYHAQSLRCWWEQTYRNIELIVVSEDDLPGIPIDHPCIKVIKCEKGLTIGAKRNLACKFAKGAIIAHWDDDDWSHQDRILQCVPYLTTKLKLVVGYRLGRFYEVNYNISRIWKWGECWVHGSSLMYLRSVWEQNPFVDANTGEDNTLLKRVPSWLIADLDGSQMMVFRDHSNCTWDRTKQYDREWKVCDNRQTLQMLNLFGRTKIVLGMISWNNGQDTLKNLKVIQEEAERLRSFDFEPYIVVVDNGSTDGTQELLKKTSGTYIKYNKKNLGSAKARNQIIEIALSESYDAEYILFVDCDIEIVPFSVMEMLRWLRINAHAAYCVGANCYVYTDNPKKAASNCLGVVNPRVEPFLAMTQYGLFYANILNKFHFDENYGPGWSMEDNDLAISIETATGLQSYNFIMPYMHTHVHRSVELLEQEGKNVEEDIRTRYGYAINKWKDNPIASTIIRQLIHTKESKQSIKPTKNFIK